MGRVIRPSSNPDRAALEARWLALTRQILPSLAVARGWPVLADHCFQRILLDVASGGVWYDAIRGRPAYVHATDAVLAAAVALGEDAVAGAVDLAALNARSIGWRRRRSFSLPVG
ncbi:MAG: GCN5-related N-acetyltransferase [Sphingomonas taxi]